MPFSLLFAESWEPWSIEGNEKIFAKVMNDEELRENLTAEIIKVVYDRIVNESNESSEA